VSYTRALFSGRCHRMARRRPVLRRFLDRDRSRVASPFHTHGNLVRSGLIAERADQNNTRGRALRRAQTRLLTADLGGPVAGAARFVVRTRNFVPTARSPSSVRRRSRSTVPYTGKRRRYRVWDSPALPVPSTPPSPLSGTRNAPVRHRPLSHSRRVRLSRADATYAEWAAPGTTRKAPAYRPVRRGPCRHLFLHGGGKEGTSSRLFLDAQSVRSGHRPPITLQFTAGDGEAPGTVQEEVIARSRSRGEQQLRGACGASRVAARSRAKPAARTPPRQRRSREVSAGGDVRRSP
jgi:hypothetical protein